MFEQIEFKDRHDDKYTPAYFRDKGGGVSHATNIVNKFLKN